MSRAPARAPLCLWLSGLLLAACGAPSEVELAPAGEPLGTAESALCSGSSVTQLSIGGISSYGGEIAGSGSWSVSSGANAVRLDYYVDGVLRSFEDRTGASGTWYFSSAGHACGTHSFEIRAYPMVIDSNGNRTVCVESPRTVSQYVEQTCATASLSCSRPSSNINCTGSGTGGAAPYRYSWNILYSSDLGNWSSGWFDGGTTLSEYCPRGFYVDAYYWNAQVQFRIIDATGVSSNVVTASNYLCVQPP
ncbi:hypothetical protein KYC5002_16880 [Archangium violaceum]|uniref:hypothetical protein n=1 Tax=Archangium violaceum TaxID=83451 RepID=UPI002B2ED13C|nr:hypothetical protein KYC5002_16880 [Archangium gephyra]